METHFSILDWRISRTEEPGGLWSIGSQSQTWLKRLSTHGEKGTELSVWRETFTDGWHRMRGWLLKRRGWWMRFQVKLHCGLHHRQSSVTLYIFCVPRLPIWGYRRIFLSLSLEWRKVHTTTNIPSVLYIELVLSCPGMCRSEYSILHRDLINNLLLLFEEGGIFSLLLDSSASNKYFWYSEYVYFWMGAGVVRPLLMPRSTYNLDTEGRQLAKTVPTRDF